MNWEERMDQLMERLLPNTAGILGSAPGEPSQAEGSRRRNGINQSDNPMGAERQTHNHYSGRVEFPYFDGATGTDPCSWLRKYERYFHYNGISDPEQKLEEVVLHISGRAEAWYFSYQLSKGRVSWQDFHEELYKRFQDAENSKFNLIGEFKKIEQKGTVNEYLEKFEDLKTWVLIRNPTMPEEFFLEFFVEGLKEEIGHTVKMLNPYTLSQAIEKARHQERVIDTLNRKSRVVWGKSANNSTQFIPPHNNVNNKGGANPSWNGQMSKGGEYRRNNGLCYRCGDKYYQGHQCKQKQINAMNASENQIGAETNEIMERRYKECQNYKITM